MKYWLLSILFLATISNSIAQHKQYHHLEGKLNGQPIAMELMYSAPSANNSKGQYFGSYYFINDGKPYQGYIDNYNKTDIKFRIYDRIYDKDQTFTGTFKDDTYIGTWTDGTQSFPFELKEKEPVTELLHFKNQESYTNSDYPSILSTTRFEFLMKDKDPELASILFVKILDGISIPEFISSTKLRADDFVKRRKAYFQDAKENGIPEDELNSSEETYTVYPVVNSQKYLVLCLSEYEIGDAFFATNYTTYYNYQLATKRWLQIEDVIDTTKIAQLDAFITTQLKMKHNVAMDQPLTTAPTPEFLFLEDEGFTPDNIILGTEGMYFVYFMGQLTTQYYGEYKLYISYKDLKGYLNKNFKP